MGDPKKPYIERTDRLLVEKSALQNMLAKRGTSAHIHVAEEGTGLHEGTISVDGQWRRLPALNDPTSLSPTFYFNMDDVRDTLSEMGIDAKLPRKWIRAQPRDPQEDPEEFVEAFGALSNLKAAAGGREHFTFTASPIEGEIDAEKETKRRAVIYPVQVATADGKVFSTEIHTWQANDGDAYYISKNEVAAAAYALNLVAVNVLGPDWQDDHPIEDVQRDYIGEYGAEGVTDVAFDDKGKEEDGSDLVQSWAETAPAIREELGMIPVPPEEYEHKDPERDHPGETSSEVEGV